MRGRSILIWVVALLGVIGTASAQTVSRAEYDALLQRVGVLERWVGVLPSLPPATQPTLPDVVVLPPPATVPTVPSTNLPLPGAINPAIKQVTAVARNERSPATFVLDDATIASNPRVQWITDRGVERRGFNASFLPSECKRVDCYVDGRLLAQGTVKAERAFAPRRVAPGVLDAELAKGGDIQLEAGVYTIGREWNSSTGPLKGVTVVGAGSAKTRINVKVKRLLGYHAIDLRDSAIHGVEIYGPVDYDPALRGAAEWDAKKSGADLFNLTGSNALVDCVLTNWRKTITSGSGANGTLVLRCEARLLKTYFVWCGDGKNVAVYDCRASNSVFEHCVRGGAWTGVAINGGAYTNQDNRAHADARLRDPKDDAKGTIVLQWGTRAYVWNVDLHGPAGTGPLAKPEGGNLVERARNVVWESCTLTVPLELWGGLEVFRITDTAVGDWEHRDARMIRDGVVPKGTRIPVGVSENVRIAA